MILESNIIKINSQVIRILTVYAKVERIPPLKLIIIEQAN